jgi:hypothetical protein
MVKLELEPAPPWNQAASVYRISELCALQHSINICVSVGPELPQEVLAAIGLFSAGDRGATVRDVVDGAIALVALSAHNPAAQQLCSPSAGTEQLALHGLRVVRAITPDDFPGLLRHMQASLEEIPLRVLLLAG